MQVKVGTEGEVILEEVYNAIVLRCEQGDFGVCMRDGGIVVMHGGREVWNSGHLVGKAVSLDDPPTEVWEGDANANRAIALMRHLESREEPEDHEPVMVHETAYKFSFQEPEPPPNQKKFMARLCHLCWVCYQMGAGQEYNEQPTEDQLKSSLDGVEAFLKNPTMTAKENHDNWWRYKLDQGWTWGPEKDVSQKLHPDMVPYDQLPEVERKKDEMDMLARRTALELWQACREGS